MTRSEALTFFDANKITLPGISGGQYIDKADFEKFAESLPETQPQEDEGKEAGWISVQDKEAPERQKILIFGCPLQHYPNSPNSVYAGVLNRKEAGEYYSGGQAIVNVTHWMPLPKEPNHPTTIQHL